MSEGMTRGRREKSRGEGRIPLLVMCCLAICLMATFSPVPLCVPSRTTENAPL